MHLSTLNQNRALIDDGANLEIRDDQGRTPLHIAVAQGWGSLTEILLNAGADAHTQGNRGQRALHSAARVGDVKTLELLVAHGANVDAVNPLNDSTPLHEACIAGQVNSIQYLLDNGACIGWPNAYMETPLSYACSFEEGDNRAAVALLLERGARMDVTNEEGDSPLDKAQEEGFEGVVAVLKA